MLALVAGCGADTIPLSSLKGELELRASADTSGIHLTVHPTDGTRLPDGQTCLRLEAKAFANGIAIPQTGRGKENPAPSAFEDNSDEDPCDPPSFDLTLPAATPSALLTPVTKLTVTDGTASFEAELRNMYTSPAFAPDPSGSLTLIEGTTATVGLDPAAPGLAGGSPGICFYPDYTNGHGTVDSFFCLQSEVTFADDSVTFPVPSVPPSDEGVFTLHTPALGPGVLSCAGFAWCSTNKMSDLYASISTPAAITQ